jgi:hypothetical protein
MKMRCVWQNWTRKSVVIPQDQSTGIAQRHARYLNEYQNLEADVIAIDSLLKSVSRSSYSAVNFQFFAIRDLRKGEHYE